MNVDDAGRSDNDSFRDAKIPAICIHSVTQDTLRILHSHSDQLKAIRKEDYYESYRLVASYLAAIDASLQTSAPASPDKPAK